MIEVRETTAEDIKNVQRLWADEEVKDAEYPKRGKRTSCNFKLRKSKRRLVEKTRLRLYAPVKRRMIS